MTKPYVTQRDPLDDFESRQIEFDGNNKQVLVSGSGPAVIVMTEMPGISPEVARFARWVRETGFTVYMPVLFGDPGRPISEGGLPYMISQIARGCIRAEFHAFRKNSSGPIAQWLRALARQAHRECGGKGVGAIGMCFTGNFALSMMLEPAMLAPVLSQPSLPVGRAGGMHIAPDELKAVKARLDKEDLTVRAYRFKGDPLCKAARFDDYHRALGDRFEATEIEDRHAAKNPFSPNPHSVLTQHLIDEAGQPTRQAVDEVLAFFTMRLS